MNEIYFEDCLNGMKRIADNSVNLVMTSPPYADAIHYGDEVKCFKTDDYVDWFIPIVRELERVMTNDGSFILNINDKIDSGFRSTYVFELIARIVKETNLKLYDRYIWFKKNGLPSAGNRLNDRVEYLFHFTKEKGHKSYIDRIRIPYSQKSLERFKNPIGYNQKIQSNGIKKVETLKNVKPNENGIKPENVIRFNTGSAYRHKNREKHPASFHPDMPHFFIEWLTDENDLVLDPFMGTGTVALVAKAKNRNYIGFEVNESYRQIQQDKLNDVDNLKLTEIESLFNK
jgi:site-specific DNA-methyltransferase (adenine-specific)/site-specific DNA-methyltransferase (cytosine-N4-specific)